MSKQKLLVIRQYLKEIESILEMEGDAKGRLNVIKQYNDIAITAMNVEVAEVFEDIQKFPRVRSSIMLDQKLKHQVQSKLVGDSRNFSSLIEELLEKWLESQELG